MMMATQHSEHSRFRTVGVRVKDGRQARSNHATRLAQRRMRKSIPMCTATVISYYFVWCNY